MTSFEKQYESLAERYFGLSEAEKWDESVKTLYSDILAFCNGDAPLILRQKCSSFGESLSMVVDAMERNLI